MAQNQPNSHFPRTVARRILERGARGEKAVVVVMKNGKPSTVWGLDQYLARKELTKQVKPWTHRKKEQEAVPDPLGAYEGGILLPITRQYIYDE